MSPFELEGRWRAVCRDEEGNIRQEVYGKNVICTNGKEFLASFLSSAAAGASTFTMRYIGVGTDATAEAAANTTLGAQVNRLSGTVSYVSNQIYQVIATFAAGSATGAIAEYGLFSSSTGGTMLSRDTESVINVGASDTLTVTLQITVS